MKAKRQKMLNLPKTETVWLKWNNYWSIPNTRNQLPVTFERLYLSSFYLITRKVDQCLLAGTMPHLNLYFIGSVPCSQVFLFALLTFLCVRWVHRITTNLSMQISFILNVLCSPLSKNQVDLTEKNFTIVSSRSPIPAFSCCETLLHELLLDLHHHQ